MDFNYSFYQNSLKSWLLALAVLFTLFFILLILKKLFLKKMVKILPHSSAILYNILHGLLVRLKFFVLFTISFYFASFFLELNSVVTNVIEKVLVIICLVQIGIWGSAIINIVFNHYKDKKINEDAASVTTYSALVFVGRNIMFGVLMLLILDNLGVDVTALIAGVGIGGIAVALAVQNILGDLFASLSIIWDKPFVIGDFIIVDSYQGTVEFIGLKTTNIRSITGEQLIMTNSDLLKSRIRNFKRMHERRVLFTLGVVYNTSLENLKKIPHLLKEIIESNNVVRFERAHFKEYGAYSLNFEVVFWVKSADFAISMDLQQDINFRIFENFQKEGIEFAYPTQMIISQTGK